MSAPGADEAARPRRRVRAARATDARVALERDRFTTAYAAATTSQQRFNQAATALRAAAAPGRHQPDPAAVTRRLDQITAQITALVEELHIAQRQHAENTIRADERRIARAERRKTRERRS